MNPSDRAAAADPSSAPEVGRAFDDMLARAAAGKPVRAEDYVVGDPRTIHADYLLDLVYAEYVARSETGVPPAVTELVNRFPQIADGIRRQIELHEALDTDVTADHCRAPDAEDGDPEAIGRYRVVTKLGTGGQGTVYRGVHPDLRRDVVIKVAARAGGGALGAEARVLAALDHPGLARVYDLDTHDGRPFAVVEYVPGRPLDVAAAAESIDPTRAARLVAEAANAVAYAHRHGVVHRDLKPQNIMLDDTGRVRVIDFGLACLFAPADEPTDAGLVAGTLRYMAPEQAQGDAAAIGPRTDVFGLGGVLYFLLTGAPPYPADERAGLLARAGRGDWDRAKLDAAPIPARLRAVCARALAPDPSDRYPNADALAAALRGATRSPRRAVVVGLFVVALIAVGIGAWANRKAGRGPPEPVTPAATVSVPPQPALEARVWNGSRYRNAISALPLDAGARLRYEADAPADRHLTLFAVEPTGEVRALTATAPRGEPGRIGYPENLHESSALTPPAGTVAVLLCGRSSGPVDVNEVRAALGSNPWPVLPRRSLVVVERDQVEVITGRGVGPPVGQPDPEGEVFRRLDTARAKLRPTCDVLAGLAFSFE